MTKPEGTKISREALNRVLLAERQQAAVVALFRQLTATIYAHLAAANMDVWGNDEASAGELLDCYNDACFAANAYLRASGLPQVAVGDKRADKAEPPTDASAPEPSEIEPYSMQARGPGERLQTSMQLVTQVIIPSLPLLQQQGMQLNFEELIGTMAKYADLPELANIVKTTGMPTVSPPQAEADEKCADKAEPPTDASAPEPSAIVLP